VRPAACIDTIVVQYRKLSPQHHLTLDARVAAVLMTILGLTSSFFIQALVDFVVVRGQIPALSRLGLGMLLVMLARAGFFALRSRLLAYLSRRINAETVRGYHRHLLGLPQTFLFSHWRFFVAATLIAVALASAFFTCAKEDVPIPAIVSYDAFAIPIMTDFGGRIFKVYVSESSTVRKGDPIIQLDDRDLLIQERSLESRIHWMELNAGKASSDLSRLYRKLLQVRLNLDRCTITSPSDGQIVSLTSPHTGEVLRKGVAVAVVFRRERTR
jgi:ABC-type multidrug transport system fused ATPase/permease subunit